MYGGICYLYTGMLSLIKLQTDMRIIIMFSEAHILAPELDWGFSRNSWKKKEFYVVNMSANSRTDEKSSFSFSVIFTGRCVDNVNGYKLTTTLEGAMNFTCKSVLFM